MRQESSGPDTGAASACHDRAWILRHTGSVQELIQRRVDLNPRFREMFRREALKYIRQGDEETGRSILEKYFGAWPEPASAVRFTAHAPKPRKTRRIASG